jgi:hypothetical protein
MALALALCTVAWASLAIAQPPVRATANVALGFYRCAGSGLADVDAFVRDVHGPVANELVDEGLWLEWSYLTHRYGDEFNRVFVYEAADLESHLVASAEFTRRMAERFEGMSPITENCPEHRDNIYTRTLP